MVRSGRRQGSMATLRGNVRGGNRRNIKSPLVRCWRVAERRLSLLVNQRRGRMRHRFRYSLLNESWDCPLLDTSFQVSTPSLHLLSMVVCCYQAILGDRGDSLLQCRDYCNVQ